MFSKNLSNFITKKYYKIVNVDINDFIIFTSEDLINDKTYDFFREICIFPVYGLWKHDKEVSIIEIYKNKNKNNKNKHEMYDMNGWAGFPENMDLLEILSTIDSKSLFLVQSDDNKSFCNFMLKN